MKKNLLFFVISYITLPANLQAYTISSIFIDIETVFQTDSMRASTYVGKLDSLRYLAQVGNLPNQEDLFKQLKPIKALSTQITYNKNLSMPLIFSDWLSNLQSSTKITTIIQKYLNGKNISHIEKKVLLAIISMMLTPNNLADTQTVSSKIESLLNTLKHNGYKIYLIGNWANIASLRKNFSNLFKVFSGVYVSGDLHVIQPATEFYTKILESVHITPEQTLWIGTEPKFISKMQQLGYYTILYNHNQHENITPNLQKYGIKFQ